MNPTAFRDLKLSVKLPPKAIEQIKQIKQAHKTYMKQLANDIERVITGRLTPVLCLAEAGEIVKLSAVMPFVEEDDRNGQGVIVVRAGEEVFELGRYKDIDTAAAVMNAFYCVFDDDPAVGRALYKAEVTTRVNGWRDRSVFAMCGDYTAAYLPYMAVGLNVSSDSVKRFDLGKMRFKQYSDALIMANVGYSFSLLDPDTFIGRSTTALSNMAVMIESPAGYQWALLDEYLDPDFIAPEKPRRWLELFKNL